jgi:multisubunit Na+/H+ antiporter MnhB subunit
MKKKPSDQAIFDAGFQAGALFTAVIFANALMESILKNRRKKQKKRMEVKQ